MASPRGTATSRAAQAALVLATCLPAVVRGVPVTPGPGVPSLAGASLRLEPGVPLGGGEFLVPFTVVDSTGTPLPIGEDLLPIAVGGTRAARQDLVFFGAGAFEVGSATALIVSVSGAGRQRIEGIAEAIREFTRPSGAVAWRGLFVAGPRPRELRALAPPAGDAVQGPISPESIAAQSGVRLWDNIGEVLADLALPDLPPRRVLVLVTDGGGEVDSRLTSASCLEAALSTRVAIYALYVPVEGAAGVGPGGQEGAAARLRHVVEESGGRLIAAGPGEDAAAALRRLVAVIDGAQGARFTAPDVALPASFSLEIKRGDEDLAATGTLRARRLLKERGIGFWPAVIVATLALGAVAALVAHLRFASAGELVVTADGARRIHRLPRSGASIGSADGNTVVFGDRRVSPNHAVLRLRRGGLILTDLRSTHGTQVNGRPVKTAVVQDGDRIVLGGTVELTYRRSRPRR